MVICGYFLSQYYAAIFLSVLSYLYLMIVRPKMQQQVSSLTIAAPFVILSDPRCGDFELFLVECWTSPDKLFTSLLQFREWCNQFGNFIHVISNPAVRQDMVSFSPHTDFTETRCANFPRENTILIKRKTIFCHQKRKQDVLTAVSTAMKLKTLQEDGDSCEDKSSLPITVSNLEHKQHSLI